MKLSHRKVLVTGAGGFIGSHLCEELVRMGADVTAMIRYTSSSNWGCLEYLAPQVKRELKVVSSTSLPSSESLTLTSRQRAIYEPTLKVR